MKRKIAAILLTTMIAFMGTLSANETVKTEKFKVYGNCGMCESRIEKAAKAEKGVISADWDRKTKHITVTYDDSKTNNKNIQQAIAKTGHDTEKHIADNKAYAKLHSCCKYERAVVE